MEEETLYIVILIDGKEPLYNTWNKHIGNCLTRNKEDATRFDLRLAEEKIWYLNRYQSRPVYGIIIYNPLEVEMLNKKIIDVEEFDVRALNCLRNANVSTIGELMKKSRRELLQTRNFGMKSLKLIEAVLQKYNLKLKPNNYGNN